MKNKKKIIIISVCAAVVLIIGGIIAYNVIMPRYNYSRGIAAYDAKDYDKAIEFFEKSENYSDAADKKTLAQHAKHYDDGVKALENGEYKKALEELIASENFGDARNKFIDLGTKLTEAGDYPTAVEAFSKVPDLGDNTHNNYANAMAAFNSGQPDTAINYFLTCVDFKDSYEKLREAYCQRGLYFFNQKKYAEAKSDFVSSNNYGDAAVLINNCDFMIAEEYYAKKNYDMAYSIYAALPYNFSYNGIAASTRMGGINVYNYVKGLAGKYNVAKGDYRVTQTSKSYGSYNYWYNTEKGPGSMEVSAVINNDGTVTISGNASGKRYTNYSSISAGVKEGFYDAKFSTTISSGGLPVGILFNDGKTTLKYEGGTTFTLSYNYTDTGEDVYFNYTYVSNYTFTK